MWNALPRSETDAKAGRVAGPTRGGCDQHRRCAVHPPTPGLLASQAAIERGFGSFGRWEELFRAVGMSLAGGSGWVVLDQNFQTGRLGTHWSGNHTQTAAYSEPLLVMDMYEHAYAIDYGAGGAKYIDAFFQNIQWGEVQRRLERAQRATGALHR
ncbi:MAG: superoxide dismutase [Myxococcaceae bacterium]